MPQIRPGAADDGIDQLLDEIERTAELAVQERLATVQADLAGRVAVQVGEGLRALETRVRSLEPSAPLPWSPARVYLRGEQVFANGASWTCAAMRGAAEGEPPGADSAVWTLSADGIANVSAELRDGSALSLVVRMAGGRAHRIDLDLPVPKHVGTWNDRQAYSIGQIVARDGGSFIATRDRPGPCPGAGWRCIAQRGKPGPALNRAQRDELEAKMRDWFATAYEPMRLEDRVEKAIAPIFAGLAPDMTRGGYGRWKPAEACERLEQLSAATVSAALEASGWKGSGVARREIATRVARAGVEAVALHLHEAKSFTWFGADVERLVAHVRSNLLVVLANDIERARVLRDLADADPKTLPPHQAMWRAWALVAEDLEAEGALS